MGIADKAEHEFDDPKGKTEEAVEDATGGEAPADQEEDKVAKVGDRAEEALKEFREEFDREEPH